jgi:SAM-dependent methyltransferase
MIAATATMRCLEIGPRPAKLGKEWVTVGLDENDYTDHHAIWGVDRLPFEDGSFDLFYASHVIEHVPWWLTFDALREAHRVLAPGGEIELHTVDFRVVVDAYLARKPVDTWTAAGRNADRLPVLWAASRLISYGNSFEDPQWHRALFDEEHLAYCLVKAGFVSPVRITTGPRGPEKHGAINLGMKAVKP